MVEVPSGLIAVLPALACPHCGLEFDADGGTLVCPRGHAFDIARQGYVSLLAGATANLIADDADMIAARERFFATGHYSRFHDAVATAAASVPAGLGPILDCGAGEGEYLARAVAARGGAGIGLDLSKPAARRTARRGPSIGSIVANGWDRLPIGDGALGAVLSVFAPRNASEFARVLAPGGLLVVLTPTPRHLRELVGPLGMISVEDGKVARLDGALRDRFELLDRERHEWVMELDAAAAGDLVAMGPSAHHGSADERAAQLAGLTADGPAHVTASGTVSVFRVR
ncbi:Methyltransferase type 11 OS=Tsukamurella paurometabola (strain ATCC 8368 / DSM / CCUG 35730/ CIP 100753 / JCM 10117 / KCTC 9821 / NBRC 16120 / NCIMB 702349/ NCTC 13040) OX=521096 GN=Tpau_1173 PE=4 SV=1 [Tsukamurella paurometabola]|uniref:Methyltransferase type 11 n=1 Tax=Tsukamurella paurometabola (strain ATCC 8368 / DSM 20162 / CCUG 35730 / CIP 100753 / JCM 10117 / KCTC 9821 / NBRC 16120 / NCIMB 702349 / NCTC 13040) TaxID=521096 RepID=D5UVZ7_TSUPD|nr:methyltransferase domain-containing protein [Tsukamurella paurometabola]ADG77804.1 Methyltransferase type 11 [Tsukamurella paurometabola DSM 20162]SUP28819.1 Ribosomal RNA large subunit methyltransferase A [Tsukamurella paurometabola]